MAKHLNFEEEKARYASNKVIYDKSCFIDPKFKEEGVEAYSCGNGMVFIHKAYVGFEEE